jgi:hypothetical protein
MKWASVGAVILQKRPRKVFIMDILVSDEGSVKVLDARREENLNRSLHPVNEDLNFLRNDAGDTFTEASFAFVCFQDVSSRLNREKALDLIRNVSEKVDYLIVSVHWGHEYRNNPDFNLQVEPGRAFVDTGADLVIGHHPHVVQTFEIYEGRFIFYSLGNFVFDQYWSQGTQEGLAIGVVLRSLGGEAGTISKNESAVESDKKAFETVVHLFPMKSHLAQSRLMQGEELEEWTERFLNYGDYSDELKEMVRSGDFAKLKKLLQRCPHFSSHNIFSSLNSLFTSYYFHQTI